MMNTTNNDKNKNINTSANATDKLDTTHTMNSIVNMVNKVDLDKSKLAKAKEGIPDTLEQLNQRFELLGMSLVQVHEVAVDVKETDVHQILSYSKHLGFKQLSGLTCVDWPLESKFQLIFNVFNWEKGIRMIIRTKVERENPLFRSITTIFPGAKYYERETHEFFGIVFEGNDDAIKPLFLENWDDIPPMRKDFDSRAYSDKKYIKREYKTSFGEPGGEPFERS